MMQSMPVVEYSLEILLCCLGGLYVPLKSPNRLQFPSVIEAFRCFHSKMLFHRGANFQEFEKRIVVLMMKCIIECLLLLNPENSLVFNQWL